MTAWNDHHYARAQEFARLLADALALAKAPAPAGFDPDVTAAPFVRPPLPMVAPALTAVPPPAPAPAEPAAPPAPAGPSAASVFKKIPWKK